MTFSRRTDSIAVPSHDRKGVGLRSGAPELPSDRRVLLFRKCSKRRSGSWRSLIAAVDAELVQKRPVRPPHASVLRNASARSCLSGLSGISISATAALRPAKYRTLEWPRNATMAGCNLLPSFAAFRRTFSARKFRNSLRLSAKSAYELSSAPHDKTCNRSMPFASGGIPCTPPY